MVGSYATLTRVHQILLLPITDTVVDAEINTLLISGDAWVEDTIAIFGVGIPIPNPPQTVIDASSYYVAMLFRRARDFASQEVSLFEKIASEKLGQWLRGTYAPISSQGTARTKEL